MADESDELDGCDLVFTDEEITKDDDIDGVVLFAGVAPEDVDQKKAEWEELKAHGL